MSNAETTTTTTNSQAFFDTQVKAYKAQLMKRKKQEELLARLTFSKIMHTTGLSHYINVKQCNKRYKTLKR